jgi:septum formation protein
MSKFPLILASASPRRAELLRKAGVAFEIQVADIDETPYPGEDPGAYVERLALEKAQAVAKKFPDRLVLAADTTVTLDGEIFGKPEDQADARRMLTAFSGKTHSVLTGHALLQLSTQKKEIFVSETSVKFFILAAQQIEEYVRSGEPMDKAGAYAIQGAAKSFVESIQGSLENVIGLDTERVCLAISER